MRAWACAGLLCAALAAAADAERATLAVQHRATAPPPAPSGAAAAGSTEAEAAPRDPAEAAPRDPTDGGRCPPKDDDDEESADDWVKKGGVVAIVFGLFVSFWSLAVIVEEYFVPALNIMCERARIPDDVAGATFMAAGASSPEMFSALISLFITHSALGAGTIIGSEIFNHLCICAGAVFYSKSGSLVLEPRILARECIFYAAACGLLVFALAEVGDSAGKDCDDWTYVRYYHGLILVGGYVIYAVVCSKYGAITAACCPMPADDEDETAHVQDAEDPLLNGADVCPVVSSHTLGSNPSDTPEVVPVRAGRARGTSVKSARYEPAANFVDQGEALPIERVRSAGAASLPVTVLAGLVPDLATDFNRSREVLTQDHVECYIWKKSRFYNAFRATTKTWQMRWAIIDNDGFRYFRGPDGGQGRAFNIFQDKSDVGSPRSPRSPRSQSPRSRPESVTIEVTDPRRNIFEIMMPGNKQRHVIFQAQNPHMVQTIVLALRRQAARWGQQQGESIAACRRRRAQAWEHAQELAKGMSAPDDEPEQEHEHESLIAWPKTCLGKAFHILLFPFKCMLHFTMVDVRGDNKAKWWPLTCIVSVAWLAAMSYAMTFCVETLGKLMGISELVMGLTVSAAGTSFPNVFASMLVARQGLGNMAISNAFGSNVFNVFMGLGLPWFLICMLGNSDAKVDGKVYHGMKQGGVGFPVLVLLGLLIAFIILLAITGMRLYKSHAYVFLLLYIGFLVWSFGWEAKGPDMGI
eukprot:TRINITY_DN10708_c0_g2_i1.p1 TRINITY_DN10708_c0_g2~~TRINITY_DN10708_c0_g2_i1.p1  ORF type:complete len:777 (+),score=265.21 TRINITY_DN10708_c0_g2_i1:75-2333(+)